VWPVRADPEQLENLMLNLVLNARDAIAAVAHRQPAAIVIETANARLDPSTPGLRPAIDPSTLVMLTVTDTGCGMTPQVRQRIFEPFFTTKKRNQGTGLGLSTVLGIVQQHDGLITCDSEPNRGTTVRIYFPRFKARASRRAV
jgi:signal transduction histidine kinase